MTTMAPEQTSGVAAGRPQPQTTIEAAGGPFIRHTQDGRRLMYTATPTYGVPINQPMVASPGYNKGYRLRFYQSGASGTFAASTGAGGVDFPSSTIQLIQIKDAYGTVLFTGPGYDMAYLVPMFSGQFGFGELADISNMPGFGVPGQYSSGIPAFSNGQTTGNFCYDTYFPFEFAKAYGVISGANASLLPTLQANIAAASSIWGTIGTQGTLTWELYADFYWLPQGAAVVPPGIGTTCQYVYQPCNPPIASGATTLVQMPRLGGYLTCLIMDLRDSTGLRVEAFPQAPRFYVDGVPWIDSDIMFVLEDMANAFQVGGFSGGTPTETSAPTKMITRPTGVLALSRKTALAQRGLGLFETGEVFLSTNPGTQIEVAGSPWGTISNTPGTLNVVAGQVVPSGVLIQGLPEV
jgi:hypothetical protein